jgi:3-hydroxyacyl-CoA dehydrogenase
MRAEETPSDWSNAVRRVGVIGAGTMGEGIAQGFAEAGIAVTLCDTSGAQLRRCTGAIARNVALARSCGLDEREPEAVARNIDPVETDAPELALAGCALVIETVPELPDLKRRIFASLATLPGDVLIASNTSSMTMDAITDGLLSRERMLGVHYFNPAHLIPAVELHRCAETSAATVAKVRALLDRIGKVPLVIEKSVPGLVINRLTAALMREIGYLLDEGVVSPRDLDAGVKASIGFRMAWVGPMEGSDFTGLDTGARVQSALLPTLSNRTGPFQQLLDRVARGDLGTKTGRGWYDYTPDQAASITEARDRGLIQQMKLFRGARNP